MLHFLFPSNKIAKHKHLYISLFLCLFKLQMVASSHLSSGTRMAAAVRKEKLKCRFLSSLGNVMRSPPSLWEVNRSLPACILLDLLWSYAKLEDRTYDPDEWWNLKVWEKELFFGWKKYFLTNYLHSAIYELKYPPCPISHDTDLDS